MKSPIDSLKQKYSSANEHLRAITDAIVKQFKLKSEDGPQVRKAVEEAFRVGHSTTTTDDWCNFW